MSNLVLPILCLSSSELGYIGSIIPVEAHEHSLSTNLLLALLNRNLSKGPYFRLIIISIIDAHTLSNYLWVCNIYYVMDKNSPVDIMYIASDGIGSSRNSLMNWG